MLQNYAYESSGALFMSSRAAFVFSKVAFAAELQCSNGNTAMVVSVKHVLFLL